jgi:hypothetical protein
MSSFRTLVLLLLMQLSHASQVMVGWSNSMNYKLMADGVVPTSGMTAVGTLNGSVIRCAAECNRLNLQGCTSFTFHKTPPCQQRKSAGITGSCQLLSFLDPDDVVMAPSNDFEQFYVADLCLRDVSNPCMNSGTCNMTRWPNICTCPIGFGGVHCELGKFYCLCNRYA